MAEREKIISRIIGPVEKSLPGSEHDPDLNFHQLLELGYKGVNGVSDTPDDLKNTRADRYSQPLMTYWYRRMNEYLKEVGDPKNFGIVVDLQDISMALDSLESNVIVISRLGETTEDNLYLVINDESSKTPTIIRSVFVNSKGTQIEHKITLKKRIIVKWERNGVVGFDRTN